MPITIAEFIYGIVVPFAAVAGVVFAGTRLRPKVPIAAGTLAGGFVVGYGLLGLGPWQPDTHWQWLPYAVLFAGLAGTLIAIPPPHGVRVGLIALCAACAAWLLVPDWADLTPSRGFYWAVVGGYVMVLTLLLEPLADRMPGALLPGMMGLTLICAAIVLVLSGNLRFAKLAAAGAATLFGITVVALRHKDRQFMRGATIVYGVLATGGLAIGQLHSFSEVPAASYLAVPVAPALLYIRPAGGKTSAAVAATLVPLVVAVLLALGG